MIETFQRVDGRTLLYQFTVNDTATWTRGWTAAIPMTKSAGPIYEYACHEGNYSMANMLTSARAEERAAQEEVR